MIWSSRKKPGMWFTKFNVCSLFCRSKRKSTADDIDVKLLSLLKQQRKEPEEKNYIDSYLESAGTRVKKLSSHQQNKFVRDLEMYMFSMVSMLEALPQTNVHFSSQPTSFNQPNFNQTYKSPPSYKLNPPNDFIPPNQAHQSSLLFSRCSIGETNISGNPLPCDGDTFMAASNQPPFDGSGDRSLWDNKSDFRGNLASC